MRGTPRGAGRQLADAGEGSGADGAGRARHVRRRLSYSGTSVLCERRERADGGRGTTSDRHKGGKEGAAAGGVGGVRGGRGARAAVSRRPGGRPGGAGSSGEARRVRTDGTRRPHGGRPVGSEGERGVAGLRGRAGGDRAAGGGAGRPKGAERRRGGRLEATTDTASAARESDTVVVIVPVGLSAGRTPDFGALDEAASSLARGRRGGALVVLETTVPVGTTRGRFGPALEASGLRAGSDFHLAYSPERVSAGRGLADLTAYPKVVGGIDEESTQAA